jgi:hypothetical protein
VSPRPICAGEELTWDSLTTEWELAAPFACRCGAPGCRGTIRGFRHPTESQRRSPPAPVSPALADLLARERRRQAQPRAEPHREAAA